MVLKTLISSFLPNIEANISSHKPKGFQRHCWRSSHGRRIHSTSISPQNPQVTRPHHRAEGLGPEDQGDRAAAQRLTPEASSESHWRRALSCTVVTAVGAQATQTASCGRAQRACENPTQPHPQGEPGREPSGLISSAGLEEVQPLEWSTYQWWWVVSTVVSFTPCFFAVSTTCNQT